MTSVSKYLLTAALLACLSACKRREPERWEGIDRQSASCARTERQHETYRAWTCVADGRAHLCIEGHDRVVRCAPMGVSMPARLPERP